MAAFVVVDIAHIQDETAYAAYRSRVSAGIKTAGGRYLARGGAVEILEGQWKPGRFVIVRFESMEAARRWWTSPEYEPLKRMRQASTYSNIVLLEGMPAEHEEAP